MFIEAVCFGFLILAPVFCFIVAPPAPVYRFSLKVKSSIRWFYSSSWRRSRRYVVRTRDDLKKLNPQICNDSRHMHDRYAEFEDYSLAEAERLFDQFENMQNYGSSYNRYPYPRTQKMTKYDLEELRRIVARNRFGSLEDFIAHVTPFAPKTLVY